MVQQQASRIAEMQTEITDHKLNISEQKRELQLLKVSCHILNIKTVQIFLPNPTSMEILKINGIFYFSEKKASKTC